MCLCSLMADFYMITINVLIAAINVSIAEEDEKSLSQLLSKIIIIILEHLIQFMTRS